MPVKNGIGHSWVTPDKQGGLFSIFLQHMSTVKGVLNKHPYYPQRYHYIDAYAGDGHNLDEGVPGSPVVFSDTIKRFGLPYIGHCIEKVIVNAHKLRDIFDRDDNMTVRPRQYPGDKDAEG